MHSGPADSRLRVFELAGQTYSGVSVAPTPTIPSRTSPLREERSSAMLETLVASLGSRHVLLVLDNCEHVLDATAEVVYALLCRCPAIRILTTSREPLGLQAETTWRVPLLSLPTADPDACSGSPRSDAVDLFETRARAARPDFALSQTNVRAISDIVIRLEGLPLAIELAAAWVRALNPEQIAARLDDSFAVLMGGGRGRPQRHRTLLATLDWSYQLLSEAEQGLFRHLAVFAGGFDIDAVESVCGKETAAGDGASFSTLHMLTRLIDQSLVQVADQGGGVARYRLLEPVRQYAARLLARGPEQDGLALRHALYYLAVAETVAPEVSMRNHVPAVHRLMDEQDNFRAVLRWSISSPEHADIAVRLVAALGWFWRTTGYYFEGRDWMQRALACDGPPGARARALGYAALLAHSQGDFHEAVALYEDSLALSNQIGDAHMQAWVHTWLAYALLHTDIARAVVFATEGLARARDVSDPLLIAQALRVLGECGRCEGADDRAAACYAESLAVLRGIGSSHGQAVVLCDIGKLALNGGDMRHGLECLIYALRLGRESSDERRVATCIEAIARAVAPSEPTTAAQLLGAAAAWRRRYAVTREAPDREGYEATVRAVRHMLGASIYAAQSDSGAHMSLQRAADLALTLAPDST